MTDPMVDLIGFLRARLDEDEAKALAVHGRHRWRWIRDGDHTLCEGECPDHIGDLMVELDADIGLGSRVELFLLDAHGLDDGPAAAEHIARWDPARVLAVITANRALLDRHVELLKRAHRRDLATAGALLESLRAVRLMAQVYADHLDFDPSWRD